MKIYIQTRGKTRDYTFLGDDPEKWWRQPVYEQGTSFEKPTLIVETYPSGWRCYISGIPSNRRDRVNTPIRYTLVINEIKKKLEEKENILSLIFSALQAFSAPSGSPLQKVLDGHFDFDLDEFIDKNKKIDNLLGKITQDKRIQKFSIDKKPNVFCMKIEKLITKKEGEGASSAVAFLNLVSDKNYIDSEIQPALNKSHLKCLSLLESLSSGKMFDDLQNTSNTSKEKNVSPENSPSSNKEKSKKKLRAMIVVITIIALAALILNSPSLTKNKSGNEYKTSTPSHTE